MASSYNPVVETGDLKILLALEPAWLVSVNGREFLSLRSNEISLHDSVIQFGPFNRKILEIQWLRPNVIRIRARSKMRSQRETLVFYPGSSTPFAVETRRRRRAFQQILARALASYYGGRVARETLHSDRRHGIGNAYPRILVGSQAVIGVDPDEPSIVVNGVMRAAIQWSFLLRRRVSIVVPDGRKQTIASRLRALPALRERFDWLQWDGERISPLEIHGAESETHVYEYRQPEVSAEVARLCALAPGVLQPVPNIAARAVSIRFRGLEVARVSEGETAFPMGEPLKLLLERLTEERRFGSRHPLARAYEESWLESNLIGQLREILPLSAGHIYPQVPSFTGEDRKIIDLLTVTKTGRLVVIEIKASADPELPFQALDYWLAVERHRKASDFNTRGYFPGMQIRDEPALLVMVAPLLAFHRTHDRITALFPSTIPIMEIGINQSWKREIKILRRRGSLG